MGSLTSNIGGFPGSATLNIRSGSSVQQSNGGVDGELNGDNEGGAYRPSSGALGIDLKGNLQALPEPTTMILVGTGLAALMGGGTGNPKRNSFPGLLAQEHLDPHSSREWGSNF